jgi:hypothetical protein
MMCSYVWMCVCGMYGTGSRKKKKKESEHRISSVVMSSFVLFCRDPIHAYGGNRIIFFSHATGGDPRPSVRTCVRAHTHANPSFHTTSHMAHGAVSAPSTSLNLPIKPPGSSHLFPQAVPRPPTRLASSELRREPRSTSPRVRARASVRQQTRSTHRPSRRASSQPRNRNTHLRHSSSFHRPPSLRCASAEPDRPGAYGAPGSSRRLSA